VSDELSLSGATDQVFYTWEYDFFVDPKRRVQVPARWRPKQLGFQFTLVLWPHNGVNDACVMVLPPERFVALLRSMQATRMGDSKGESLQRSLGSKSMAMELDSAGRLCLPEKMAKSAGLESQAKLVGLVTCFQIWNPQRYEQIKASDESGISESFKLLN
jgi:MraZ protein